MAKMFIGGESVDSVTKNTTEVRNPATGATVDAVPQGNDKDVQQAIQAAEDAFKVWSDVTPEDRGNALLNAGELIKKNAGEIAQLLTQEQGKTLFEAGLEIHHLVHGLEFYAGLAPFCGSVGEELLRNPRIRRIAFTGSTPVGRHVMEVAGREIKRVTLELGGSDPMIVMEDANLDLAVKMADVGRYFNCGQMCLGVKRLFLQESIADNFLGGLVEILKKKTVGNGMSKETRMGPIHIGSQRQEIEEQVEDAKARGAKTLFGGERPKGGDLDKGFFYLPTLMSNVPDDARMTKEEVFGPALPVYTFKTLDEALEKANSSEFGLGSSIWTRNLLNANKAIDKLQAGNVWVNSLHYGYDELPFGGVKSSGVGREHGPEALDYYLEPKGVVIVNV